MSPSGPLMFSMNRCLVVALLSCVLGASVSAQTLGVRTLALRSGEMPEVYVKGPKNHILLEFSSVQPGELLQALKANPLPLYTKGMNAEGEEAFKVSSKVKLPSGAKGVLIMGWTAGEETRYVAIEDNFAAARFNDWLLINTGTRPVAFTVGEKARPVMLPPGGSVTHRVGAERGKGTAVLAQAPIRGKTRTFFSTYWPVHPDKRTVVLFVDDGEKIRVKRISDPLAPPAKPAEG